MNKLHKDAPVPEVGLPSADSNLTRSPTPAAPLHALTTVPSHAATKPPGTPHAHGERIPHHDTLARAFGHHELRSVRASVGSSAAATLTRHGAVALAQGSRVFFEAQPSLWVAAHEAAHVIQQRLGARPEAVGEAKLETHADQIADVVIAQRSAERALDNTPGAGGPSVVAVQRLVRDDIDLIDERGATERTLRALEERTLTTGPRAMELLIERGGEDLAQCKSEFDALGRYITNVMANLPTGAEGYGGEQLAPLLEWTAQQASEASLLRNVVFDASGSVAQAGARWRLLTSFMADRGRLLQPLGNGEVLRADIELSTNDLASISRHVGGGDRLAATDMRSAQRNVAICRRDVLAAEREVLLGVFDAQAALNNEQRGRASLELNEYEAAINIVNEVSGAATAVMSTYQALSQHATMWQPSVTSPTAVRDPDGLVRILQQVDEQGQAETGVEQPRAARNLQEHMQAIAGQSTPGAILRFVLSGPMTRLRAQIAALDAHDAAIESVMNRQAMTARMETWLNRIESLISAYDTLNSRAEIMRSNHLRLASNLDAGLRATGVLSNTQEASIGLMAEFSLIRETLSYLETARGSLAGGPANSDLGQMRPSLFAEHLSDLRSQVYRKRRQQHGRAAVTNRFQHGEELQLVEVLLSRLEDHRAGAYQTLTRQWEVLRLVERQYVDALMPDEPSAPNRLDARTQSSW